MIARFVNRLMVLRKELRDKVGLSKDTIEAIIPYLIQFGYLSPDKAADVATVVQAIRILRKLVRGAGADRVDVDEGIDKILAAPRCGIPDNFAMGATVRKWGLKKLTYSIGSYVPGLSNREQDEIIEAAFQSWAKHCDMDFVPSHPSTNLVISTGEGPRDNFDGPYGTLAWAYLPHNSNFTGQLLMKFDRSETWLNSPSQRGILMLNVAAHEIGHLLGLEHSQDRDALMAPYYDMETSRPQTDDIRRVVGLYGERPIPPPPPVDPPVDPEMPAALFPRHFTPEGLRIVRSWRAWNPNVIEDVEIWNKKIEDRKMAA